MIMSSYHIISSSRSIQQCLFGKSSSSSSFNPLLLQSSRVTMMMKRRTMMMSTVAVNATTDTTTTLHTKRTRNSRIPPSPNTTSSSSYMEFPCVDRLQIRQQQQQEGAGPEPNYDHVVSGYSLYHHNHPYRLVLGGTLPRFTIAYETWGTLNPNRDNVILLHTGLSASSHAKSHSKNKKPGWWESFIGPGSSIDTDKFFVICTNVLGGCYGSTGPSSIDPRDGQPFATRFPLVTIFDMVRSQFLLLDHLGIQRLYASVGSSMGGMQSLAAGALFPERVGRVISISAAARAHPFSIAMRYAQRQALMMDPNWKKGFYYGDVLPHAGMKLARQIGTITYRSGPEWEQRFGRRRSAPETRPSFCADYLVESYLDHQSDKWYLTYDPNSYLYISKAMDMFDMSAPLPEDPNVEASSQEDTAVSGSDTIHFSSSTPPPPLYHTNSVSETTLTTSSHPPSPQQQQEEQTTTSLSALVKGLSTVHMPTLVMGAQSDILFPIWQQKEISDALKRNGNPNVTYYELDALYGHDTFLIDRVNVGSAVKGHLEMERFS